MTDLDPNTPTSILDLFSRREALREVMLSIGHRLDELDCARDQATTEQDRAAIALECKQADAAFDRAWNDWCDTDEKMVHAPITLGHRSRCHRVGCRSPSAS